MFLVSGIFFYLFINKSNISSKYDQLCYVIQLR